MFTAAEAGQATVLKSFATEADEWHDGPDKEVAVRLGAAHTSEKHAHVDVREKGIDLYPVSTLRRILDRFFEVGE